MSYETYHIPVNFTDAGKLFGVFEIRNAVETVLLCIPIMHVHADGECNPDMLKALDSHAATSVADEQPDDEEQNDSGMADPRWEALRKLKDNKNN